MRYGTIIALTVVGAFVAAAPFAAQAQTTTDKPESRMEQAKDKVKSTTADAKSAVSDSWVTVKTKIALFADERVKGTQVSVDTKNGVVHLRGKVDSGEAKQAAAEVAKGVEHVKSVKNELQVVSPAARKAVDASDKDIAKAVEARMSKDRYLEHARISYFENAGNAEYLLASADWMPRNLDRRVEIAFPVLDPALQAQIGEMLDIQLADTVKARRILPDGSSARIRAASEYPLRSQERLYEATGASPGLARSQSGS